MRMHLDDLHSGLSFGIDFDYFWSNASEKDIPYYKNQQLAVEICFLYYEKRLTKNDIIKYYYPELSDSAIGELIRDFTVAVIKHQKGIRKVNDFSYEEVADYYNRHKDDFGVVSTKIYRNYFAKIKKNGPYAKVRPNKFITYDLIKEKYLNYFRLENTDANQVKEIFKNCGHIMSKDIVKTLESLFGVTHANTLSDEEWEEVINFLGFIQLANEYDSQSKNNAIEDKETDKKRKTLIKNNDKKL